MPPPYVAKVKIEPAERSPVLTPSQANRRNLEVIAPQKAPDPPRYGDTPSRRARMPMYSMLARKPIRAVAALAQSGVLGKTEFDLLVSQPQGKALAWDERANIAREFPDPYGNNYNVVPQTGYESHLRTLLRI